MTSKTSNDSRWPKLAKIAASVQHPGQKVSVTPGNTPVIDSPHAIVTRAHGPLAQVTQTNQLSTPVFVVLIVALFIAATISAIAVGMAFNANYAAQIAERESRLAQAHVDTLNVDVKVMRAELESKGLQLPSQER